MASIEEERLKDLMAAKKDKEDREDRERNKATIDGISDGLAQSFTAAPTLGPVDKAPVRFNDPGDSESDAKRKARRDAILSMSGRN